MALTDSGPGFGKSGQSSPPRLVKTLAHPGAGWCDQQDARILVHTKICCFAAIRQANLNLAPAKAGKDWRTNFTRGH